MTRPEEILLAQVFEELIARGGTPLGRRVAHDGIDDTGLTVDFTYYDPLPPAALEVTMIQDSDFLSSGDASDDLADRLNAAAQREGLVPFAFTIKSEARIRKLDAALVALMRAGRAIRTQEYTSDDLIREDQQGTLAEFIGLHRRLETLGVVEAEPVPSWDRVVVNTWRSSTQFRPLSNLEEVIADNIQKLIDAGPAYQRHLVVYVAAFGISQYTNITPVPKVPDELDRLWVFHDTRNGSNTIVPWSAGPAQREWEVHPPVLVPSS